MPTDVTFSPVPDSGSAKQGVPDNYGITFLNGRTTCYCSLSKGGVEETTYSRVTVTTALQWAQLIPQSSGSNYTVVAYDASSGGNVVGTSSSFTVSSSSLPSLPLAGDAVLRVLGDSTIQYCYTFTGFNRVGAQTNSQWLPIAMRMLGYPVDISIWPNYHGTGNANESGQGGGAIDGLGGDQTIPHTYLGEDYPGYLSRLSRNLIERPQLLIVQVTVNDPANAVSTATSIANYQTIADAVTLAGCRVLFVLMRPLSSAYSSIQADRVTINNGVVSICGSVSGCDYWDPSPVYTRGIGGPSAYNDPEAIVENNQIIGFHPTPKGAKDEAISFIARATTLGLFGTDNYALTIFNNVAGETNLTQQPIFNGGTGGVTLNSGASGTWATGISIASGSGATNTTVVGSVVANSDTGGYSQRMTLTPGGTGSQATATTFVIPAASITGYIGWIEMMMEVDIVTDTESLIQSISLNAFSRSNAAGTYIDGENTSSVAAGYTLPAPTGVEKYWHYCRFWCDGFQNSSINSLLVLYTLNVRVDVTGRGADAVVDIRRHYCRKLQLTDPKDARYLPDPVSIATTGNYNANSMPMRATFSGSGVKPQGVRWFYRITPLNNLTSTWNYGGDAYIIGTAGTCDFTVTGLTNAKRYDIKAEALRYGGTLALGLGNYYAEGTETTMASFNTFGSIKSQALLID